MLTKADLNQIRKVVREEIEVESRTIRSELRAEMKITRIEIENDLRDLADKLKNQEITLNRIQKDIEHIKKDTKEIVDFFDKEYLGIKIRVEKLERIITPSSS